MDCQPQVASAVYGSVFTAAPKTKSRRALAFFRDRWRSDVLHQSPAAPTASATSTGVARRQTPVRRCHSQPTRDDDELTGSRPQRILPTLPLPQRPPSRLPLDRRDVGVQCSIIGWNPFSRRIDWMTEFPTGSSDVGHQTLQTSDEQQVPACLGGGGPVGHFSSQEISLAATDGSGTTTFGDDEDDGGDYRTRLGWFSESPQQRRSALACHSAPPPTSSQSMAALGYVAAGPGASSRGGQPTRVAQLRHEYADRGGECSAGSGDDGTRGRAARNSSCYSEPEVVRCCSASAAAIVAPRVDVAALRRQFRRRKAITLSDLDVEQAFCRMSENAARGSLSQKSAVTQQSYLEQYHSSSALNYQTFYPPVERSKSATGRTGESPYAAVLSASDLGMRSDTLLSPRISPLLWLQQCIMPSLVVTSSSRDQYCHGGESTSSIDDSEARHLLGVPRRDVRRSSFSGDQSTSEESDADQSPPLPRRGRRQAIFDSKSLGLVSNIDDGDFSPSNSCDEIETSNLLSAERPRRRKRSSADLGINYPGDLLSQVRPKRPAVVAHPLLKRNTIADFANTRAYHASTISLISGPPEDKKLKTTFSLLKLIDKKSHRSKDTLPELGEVLRNLKRSEFKDSSLSGYKNSHWMDLLYGKDGCPNGAPMAVLTENERKRREAVWELFQSETVFLIDHLMVLKHCFMEPLKKVQVEGHLMFAEPQDLFGNLDELCYVSYTFSRDFITLLRKEENIAEFGKTAVLLKGLKRFFHVNDPTLSGRRSRTDILLCSTLHGQYGSDVFIVPAPFDPCSNFLHILFCQLTRDGEVYHDYCLNYSKAITYLEQLRKNDDFCEFEKWCCQDERCHRLQLTDLLISPMQHCTKVPLLLNNIRRYTNDQSEQHLLTESLEKLEKSIYNLEAKILWLKNYERVQDIQQQIVWQPVTELEPRAFIPEFLRGTLSRQPCERLLASPRRQLLCEGPVTLIEISKAVDMYMFLFDDILLLTRIKKAPRKKAGASSDAGPNYSNQLKVQTDGAVFVVHRQPIALDRFTIHDIQLPDSSGFEVPYHHTELPATASTGQSGPIFVDPISRPGVAGSGSTAGGGVGPGTGAGGCAGSTGPGAGTGGCQSGGGSPDVEPATHESCLPHFRDDCNRHLLFGCLSAASALYNAFVLVQVSRFQQVIGVFTLQAPSEMAKDTWLARLHEAQEAYKQACRRADSIAQESATATTAGSVPGDTLAGSSRQSGRRDARRKLPLDTPGLSVTANGCNDQDDIELTEAALRGSLRDSGVVRDDETFVVDRRCVPNNVKDACYGPKRRATDTADGDSGVVGDDEVAEAALRHAGSRKIRSSSSDAATATDLEAPRPVSPRRISDPICQHTEPESGIVRPIAAVGTVQHHPSSSVGVVRLLPKPIMTTAQTHPQPRPSTAAGAAASPEFFDSPPSSAGGRLEAVDRSAAAAVSTHHCWRFPTPSTTPTVARQYRELPDPEITQRSASSTPVHHGSAQFFRTHSGIVAPFPAAVTTPRQDDRGGRGPPRFIGHYRRPAACRSETASPVIDDDDDDDIMTGVTSSPTGTRRYSRHMSVRLRRHLKSINERSQSTDTIYV